MPNTFLRTKKVGSPCESISIVSGNARQIRRTLSRCFSPLSIFCCFIVFLIRDRLTIELSTRLTSSISPSSFTTSLKNELFGFGFAKRLLQFFLFDAGCPVVLDELRNQGRDYNCAHNA